jgi:hypothetical protein
MIKKISPWGYSTNIHCFVSLYKTFDLGVKKGEKSVQILPDNVMKQELTKH